MCRAAPAPLAHAEHDELASRQPLLCHGLAVGPNVGGALMGKWFAENAGAIGTFVGGLITGGAAGWAITYKSMKAKIMVGGRVADQSRARAGGDNVGGNKTTIGRID